MTPDVNVLVAASRRDHPHHPRALAWLEAARATGKLVLIGTVVASFLRLVTQSRVFPTPTPVDQAVGVIDDLLASRARLLASGDEWPRLRALCLARQQGGNAIPDAWIAACVLQHAETLATFDRDFLRLLPAERLELLQA